MPNPMVRQSTASTSRTGSFGRQASTPRRGRPTTRTARPPRRRRRRAARIRRAPSWTAAPRSAPIDTRSAISRWRTTACAVSRLATLVHAINSTSPTSAARTISGRRKLFCATDAPEPAGSSRTCSLRYASMRCAACRRGSPSPARWSPGGRSSAAPAVPALLRRRAGAASTSGTTTSRGCSAPRVHHRGMKTSVRRPGSVPVNPRGATPMISYGCDPSRSVRPTTPGSPPNRRVQKS